MTAGAPTLGGLRRFNTVTVQNLIVTGTLTASSSETVAGATTITASSANALAVGRAGTTNPAFNVATNATTSATGIAITAAAAASGVAIAATSSGTDENVTFDAKGAGTVTINGTATGGITLGRAVTLSSTINKVTITAPASAATLTLVTGSSLITAGAFATTLTATGTTNVTLPTTGTLATLAGSEALSNKSYAGSTATLTGAVTAKSATAVPASAGAIAAGAPVNLFSGGNAIWITSDAPAFSATKGDLCINTAGSSSSTRLYVNNGTTTWIAITTAS